MKAEYYSDRDMCMITYTHETGVKFSICNKTDKKDYLVQCTKLGIYFRVDAPDMGVKIIKQLLDEGT